VKRKRTVSEEPRETEMRKALRACRTPFLIVLLFSFAVNLLMMVSPIYMMQIFDHVLSSRSIDTLVMLTAIVGVALAVLSLIDGIRAQILARLGGWIEERMGPSVLNGALHLALHTDSGRAGQGLRDVATVRGFFGGPAIMPLLDAPWAPLFIGSLFVLHPALGLVGVAGAFLLFGLALLNEVMTQGPLRQAGTRAGRLHYRIEAALRNADAIRAMGMLNGIVRLWRRDAAEVTAAQRSAANRGAIILAVSKFLRLATQTLIMGVAAWLVIERDISPGAMFASSFLLGRALAPVENAIGTWKSLVAARLAYRRLNDLLSATAPAQNRMAMPRPQGELVVERVSFIPPGAEEPTLRGVSFALAPGEVLGIVGPSAAGKSTLARIITGSWKPIAGHVRLDGADIGVWLEADCARHLGYLPQDIELFSGSVKENIARLGEAEPEAVIAAAQLVGLHDTIMRLPEGYDSDIGEDGVRLSGGQRQRVGIARALFGKPSLVVLDEPNASLDFEGEEALLSAIAHLKAQGTTVIVIAHRPSILGLADKVLVLRNGTVEAFGNRAEIIAKLNAGSGTPSLPAERASSSTGTGLAPRHSA
jgi:PrtD family type I secretion system ABC transporter